MTLVIELLQSGNEWAAVFLRLVLGCILIDAGLNIKQKSTKYAKFFRRHKLPIGSSIILIYGLVLLLIIQGLLILIGAFIHFIAVIVIIEYTIVLIGVKQLKHFKTYKLELLIFASALALLFIGAGPLSIDSLYFISK